MIKKGGRKQSALTASSQMLMQSILGTCCRSIFFIGTVPVDMGQHILKRIFCSFLTASSSIGIAQNSAVKRESIHDTGTSNSPTMLESGSSKLLSIFISGKINLHNLERQELADSHLH